MNTIIHTTTTPSSSIHYYLSCLPLLFSKDCYPFLNWSEDKVKSEDEKAVVFRSLVATLKLQPVLNDTLEAQAVSILTYIIQENQESSDMFVASNASFSDQNLTGFVQSLGVLFSTVNPIVTTTALKMLRRLVLKCSDTTLLTLVKADLIPKLILALNPQSLSFADAVDIHTNLMATISKCVWLATPDGLAELEIHDRNERHAVHETILQQVISPCEAYIFHLCVNRYSIIDGDQSNRFMAIFAKLPMFLQSHQPAMNFIIQKAHCAGTN
ncbi:hypothetical protein BLNAU_5437 [Blattamonas nauphoetae]|uniref:Uncharacterized protein n=1 Tax=Blattamonas nauphoetae TaxID=2049346 RepID=A0ABQ9Y7J3_9EUKA|nr:hypothetical protein BLNAU_5437 [Blattamonas nauphoetae]